MIDMGKEQDTERKKEIKDQQDHLVRHNTDRRERFAAQSRADLEKQASRKTEFGVRKKPPGRLARLKRLLRR